MKKNVLFVCAGNTCRSPMAEFILKKKRPDLYVKSAGLYAIDGFPMSRGAQIVLSSENYAKDEIALFKSKTLTEEDLKKDNIIFVMNEYLKSVIAERGRSKDVYLLGDLDIPDPFGHEVEDYKFVKNMIEQAIDRELMKSENLH